MGKLVFVDSDEEVEIEDGEPIQEACEAAGVAFGCTEGICGSCYIEVEEGMENLTPVTQEEEDILVDLDFERLACQCRINGGCVRIKY